MKRFLALILIAVAVVSCGGNTYNIKGSVTPTDDLKDAFVVMQNVFNNKMDTAMIVNGKFSFKGEADTTAVAVVSLVGAPRGARAVFVPE